MYALLVQFIAFSYDLHFLFLFGCCSFRLRWSVGM